MPQVEAEDQDEIYGKWLVSNTRVEDIRTCFDAMSWVVAIAALCHHSSLKQRVDQGYLNESKMFLLIQQSLRRTH